jgi:hypothetical protein
MIKTANIRMAAFLFLEENIFRRRTAAAVGDFCVRKQFDRGKIPFEKKNRASQQTVTKQHRELNNMIGGIC